MNLDLGINTIACSEKISTIDTDEVDDSSLKKLNKTSEGSRFEAIYVSKRILLGQCLNMVEGSY